MIEKNTQNGDPAPTAAPRPRLVVIDESPAFACSIQEIAEDVGYEVEVAWRVDEVMMDCWIDPPDIILIGHVSPATDALDLINWLDDRECDSKVLVVTDGSKPYPNMTRPSHERPVRLNLETYPRPLSAQVLRAVLRRAAVRRG